MFTKLSHFLFLCIIFWTRLQTPVTRTPATLSLLSLQPRPSAAALTENVLHIQDTRTLFSAQPPPAPVSVGAEECKPKYCQNDKCRGKHSQFFAYLPGSRWCGRQKMWNASRFCVSSLRRGHANLLCIVPILVYVLLKQVRNSLLVTKATSIS